MAEKKMYVVHTQRGYWVGAFIFNEQLRFAKIYTSLHYANETVDRIKRAYPNEDAPKVLEVQICLAQNMPTADVVEVVRCRRCKHWKKCGNDPIIERFWGECCRHLGEDGGLKETAENDFCSYGERR